MIDPDVVELREIQHVGGPEAINTDDGVRLDALPDNF